LKALEKHYSRIATDGKDGFGPAVFTPLWEGKWDSSADDFIALITDPNNAEARPFQEIEDAEAWVALFAAVAYCVQAMKADQAGNQQSAWDFAFDAAQWEGLLAGILNSSADALSEFSRRGGEARSEKSRQMQEEAVRLYKQKKWKSPNAAAGAIHQAVRKFGIDNGILQLTTQNSERTVYGYLRAYVNAQK
jgi:hypothetical protein